MVRTVHIYQNSCLRKARKITVKSVKIMNPQLLKALIAALAIIICEKRDPKGLYEKARAGLIPEFTGVNAPYLEFRVDYVALGLTMNNS